MKRIIQEKTVSDLRADLTKFGYSEKGKELNSGGELQSNFVDILSYLLKEWKDKNGDSCKLQFTAGNDTFHKNRKSRHTNGEAVDLTLSQECRQSFIKTLERYKSIYNGFSYIDEYTHPSKGATGGHFHLSYRQGQPEGSSNDSGNNGETDSSDITSSEPEYNVYAGLTNAMTGGLGADSLKKAGEEIWGKTMGKIQKAMGESVNVESNRLDEEINKIKKLIKH